MTNFIFQKMTRKIKTQTMKSILIISFLCISANVFSQNLTDSTCRRYFEMTAQLIKGDTISKTDFYNFLQDKNIQIYLKDQGLGDDYGERYRRSMQVVYMPKNASILATRLKTPEQYWLTYIINEYKIHETEMKAYLNKISSNPNAYYDTCYQYAFSALAKSSRRKLPNATFSIIPIHNDAHASGNTVIYTLLCAYANDANHYGALGGHELHHMLRPQADFVPQPKDEVLVNVLNRVLNEGSADMIDKKYSTDTAKLLTPYQRYFQVFFDDAKIVLPRMDSLISASAKREQKFKVRDFFKGSDFSNGHVPGTYMSHYIENNGLKPKLLKHLDDPFYYFLVYNEAAKKDKSKPFVFSKQSIAYLTSLRKLYLKSK